MPASSDDDRPRVAAEMAPDGCAQAVGAATALCRTAAAGDWRGSDPYDGLWRRWPAPLTGGRRRRQAIMQLHVRAPVDIRRLYRRSDPLLAKTLGLFASACLQLDALGVDGARAMAIGALTQLDGDRRAGSAAWGYPFDVQTRWSFYPASEPSIVPTAFAVSALVEAAAQLDRADLGERARGAARWVLESLYVDREGYFSYHPHSQTLIHNANLLGARLVFEALGDEGREPVLRSIDRTLEAQQADGSWPYGAGQSGVGWADSFHTGYVLICLAQLRELEPAIDGALARGARFYERFFGPRGESRLWSDRPYPEDGHSAGTGLSTLALLTQLGHIAPERLALVARRLLAAGIRRDHVVFRRYRWGVRSTVAYPRWCDGHVALGLAQAAPLLGVDVASRAAR